MSSDDELSSCRSHTNNGRASVDVVDGSFGCGKLMPQAEREGAATDTYSSGVLPT